MSARI